jgi:hypothetical protein
MLFEKFSLATIYVMLSPQVDAREASQTEVLDE